VQPLDLLCRCPITPHVVQGITSLMFFHAYAVDEIAGPSPSRDVPSVEALFKPTPKASKVVMKKWAIAPGKSIKKAYSSKQSPPAKRKANTPKPAWNGYLTDGEQYRLPKERVLLQKKAFVSNNWGVLGPRTPPDKRANASSPRMGASVTEPLDVARTHGNSHDDGVDAAALLDADSGDSEDAEVRAMEEQLKSTFLATPVRSEGDAPTTSPRAERPARSARAKSTPRHARIAPERSPRPTWALTTKSNVGGGVSARSPTPKKPVTRSPVFSPVKSSPGRGHEEGRSAKPLEPSPEQEQLQLLKSKLASVGATVAAERQKCLELEMKLEETTRELHDTQVSFSCGYGYAATIRLCAFYSFVYRCCSANWRHTSWSIWSRVEAPQRQIKHQWQMRGPLNPETRLPWEERPFNPKL